MEKRTFNITISTPIGKRSGVMAMNIEGGEMLDAENGKLRQIHYLQL